MSMISFSDACIHDENYFKQQSDALATARFIFAAYKNIPDEVRDIISEFCPPTYSGFLGLGNVEAYGKELISDILEWHCEDLGEDSYDFEDLVAIEAKCYPDHYYSD